jgi:hypothetical protein
LPKNISSPTNIVGAPKTPPRDRRFGGRVQGPVETLIVDPRDKVRADHTGGVQDRPNVGGGGERRP